MKIAHNSGIKFLLFIVILFSSLETFAVARSWTGGGGDGLWSNVANWDGGTLPDPALDDITIDCVGCTVTYDLGVPLTIDVSLTLGGLNNTTLNMGSQDLDVDGTMTIESGSTLYFANLSISG